MFSFIFIKSKNQKNNLNRKKSSFFLYMIIFGFEEKLRKKFWWFFSSPSKFLVKKKKIKKPKKKSVIKKNENFFFCFCFSLFFSSFSSPNFSVLFSPSPLFHFWNVCVISSCFNRTWLEFVSIRLEQFFRVIRKKREEKKTKTFLFALSIPSLKKKLYRSSAVVYLNYCTSASKKTFFCHLKKTKRVQEKNANKKILDLKSTAYLICVTVLSKKQKWSHLPNLRLS